MISYQSARFCKISYYSCGPLTASTFLEFCIKLVRETEPTILDGLFTCSMMTFVVDCRLKRNTIPCVSLLELKAFESQSQRNGSVVKPHIYTFGIPAYADIVNKVNINIYVYIYIYMFFHTQLDLTSTIGTPWIL